MTVDKETSCRFLQRVMSGYYGCIWNDEHDKATTTRWQIFWFTVLMDRWIEASIFLHWTVAMGNDHVAIDGAICDVLHMNWFCWYKLMYAFSIIVFTYVTSVMVFAYMHVFARKPLYMSVWHRVPLVLCAVVVISFTILVLYSRGLQQFHILLLAFDISGPNLQIFFVLIMAVLTWPIAWKWLRWNIGASRISVLIVYVGALLLLYIWPLVVTSPAVTDVRSIPARPALIADGGAASIAPENTILSLQIAQRSNPLAVKLDVYVSNDGTPFVFRDPYPSRTTDISEKFPQLAQTGIANLNLSVIRQLDVGSWYLNADPYQTVWQLSSEQRDEIKQQKIPTLEEALTWIEGVAIVVHTEGVATDHPHRTDYIDRIVAVVQNSKIPTRNVYWYGERPVGGAAFNVVLYDKQKVSEAKVNDVVKVGYNVTSIEYSQITRTRTRAFLDAGMMVNVYNVNTEWLFSLVWLMGVSTVTTEYIYQLSSITKPGHIVSPDSYMTLWIMADVVSVLLVLVFWFVNYMIFLSEKARNETLLMEDMSNNIYDGDGEAAYSTPPQPGQGLERKKLPYESTKGNVGID